MTLFTWLRPSSKKATKSQPRPATRLGVDRLEDRTVPSWLAQVGGPAGAVSMLRGAADADGNTYLGGYYSGTVDLDPSAEGVVTLTGGSTFIAKYTPQGALAWGRNVGANINGVAVDPSGNPYLYGPFSGPTDFGGGWTYTNRGNADPYLLRLDGNTGATVWAEAVLGSSAEEAVMGVNFGADGCVYATGRFSFTADFDPGSSHAGNPDLLTATGASKSGSFSDAFIWKLNAADGGFRAAWKVGGADGYEGGSDLRVEVDATGVGSVYLAGQFGGTADLDPGAGLFTRTSAGTQDVFLARYVTDGMSLALGWAGSAGGPGYEQHYRLAADVGSLYLTGGFSGTADFDLGTGKYDLTSAGNSDGVVARYRMSDGGLEWARRVGGPGSDGTNETFRAAVSGGAVYAAGIFQQTADFDAAYGYLDRRDLLTSRGGDDGFVLKLDAATGKFANVWQVGGAGNDSATIPAVYQTETGPMLHIVGRVNSTSADLPDGSTLANPDGMGDAFILVMAEPPVPLGPPPVSVSGGSVVEGNSGLTALTFTVSLSWASAEPVVMNYRTLDGTATAGSDYQYQQGTLTFAPGETVKTVTVWVIGDTAVEANETFSLALYTVDWVEFARALGTILNDDTTTGGGKKK